MSISFAKPHLQQIIIFRQWIIFRQLFVSFKTKPTVSASYNDDKKETLHLLKKQGGALVRHHKVSCMNIAFSIQKYRKDCKITHDPMYGKQRFLPTIEKSYSYSAFEDLEKDGKTHWLNPVARKVGNRIHKKKKR